VFPEQWHRIVDEALRIRRADHARADAASALTELLADLRMVGRESLYRTPLSRRRDAIAFGEMVMRNAQQSFGQ
jgi:hypothetical protein